MAKILIVEDNLGTNKAICEYMKEAGHTLFSTFTGSEALKIFREKELDIIVLDIMLPEMSGIIVLHEIRKISNIPVIMLTALDDEYTQSNSFDEMADDYITKPFSMLILGKRITALLRRSQNKPTVNMVKLGDIIYICNDAFNFLCSAPVDFPDCAYPKCSCYEYISDKCRSEHFVRSRYAPAHYANHVENISDFYTLLCRYIGIVFILLFQKHNHSDFIALKICESNVEIGAKRKSNCIVKG